MAQPKSDWQKALNNSGVTERKGSDVRIQTSYRPQVNERWVRPDGVVETNVKMDIVIAAATKAMKP